nr:hypothetical protein CFP56_77765 [Quercus suber]
MSLKAKKELLSDRIKDLKVYVDENKLMGHRAKAKSSNDVDYVGLTLEMLKNRIPKMLLKHCLMNRTLVSVLFLDELKLERVLAFLKEELKTSCGLRSLHTSITRDRLRGDPKIIRKEIVLSDDLSHLIPLFDESKSFGLNLLCFSSFLAAHSRHYPLDPKVAGPIITNELEQEEFGTYTDVGASQYN